MTEPTRQSLLDTIRTRRTALRASGPVPPFHESTVVEIPVPSGRLIVKDNLSDVPFFRVKPEQSINYGAGLDAWARLHADRAQVAYGYAGNSCPHIMRQRDGSLLVVELAYDEERAEAGEDPLVTGPEETSVAQVITDLWAVMLTDYEHWLSHGGPAVDPDDTTSGYALIEVPAGTYRWTVFSHNDAFDMHADGRIEIARLELIAPAG